MSKEGEAAAAAGGAALDQNYADTTFGWLTTTNERMPFPVACK